ncbi:hypothetical protein Tco_0890667 [Tanacetum coccineum]|uniref:Uncharacterized protein n=1 Tax=Tanacetum coccineum TaxID=301880 RepID=A0ABQ5C0Q3_9ASTR
MSRFNIPEAIDKSVIAHLMKNVLPKDTLDFGKLGQEKAAKKSMPKYSTTQFDEDSLTKRRDDKDQDPSTGSKMEKKKRKQKDYESSKKDKDQAGSSKKGKSPSKSSKTDKSVNAKDIVHDVEMDVGESVENDVVDAEYPSQADASATKQDKSTWFKTSWFNDMVNTEKNQHTFDDVMVSVIDFTNFTKNFLKKDKIVKAGLEGLAFKLMKGGHKNYIELEYNFEQCYLALSDQLDWVNPKGDKIPYDLSKPLPLHGTLGHLTILADFFFNKDLEYLTIGNVEKKYATLLTKPKAARSRQAVQSSHKVHSRMKILSIVGILVDKQFGYGYLKEFVVRRANQKEYTFKEADFPRLHLNDIEDMYPLYAQNKLYHLTSDEQIDIVRYAGLDNKEPYTIFYESKGVVYLNKDDKKYLMRADKVYMFGDGTLKKVRDKLHYMLHNFELGYNDGMAKRAWIGKDQKWTASMLEKIEKTLLTRQIMRSLECFVGGRKIEMDFRLLTRTE